jgi:anti-sigma B factor antagonist
MSGDDRVCFETRDADGLITLVCSGEIDLTAEEALVQACTAVLPSCKGRQLLLDLTEVSFMDSSGVRAVLRCQRAAEEAGVTLRLVVGKGPVTRLFAVAGVAEWFEYQQIPPHS